MKLKIKCNRLQLKMNVNVNTSDIFAAVEDQLKIQIRDNIGPYVSELMTNQVLEFRKDIIADVQTYATPFIWGIISAFIVLIILSSWNCVYVHRIYREIR